MKYKKAAEVLKVQKKVNRITDTASSKFRKVVNKERLGSDQVGEIS